LPTRLRKIRKQRASRFHGWGQVGQHRKTGGKGGSGKSGLFKHKWTWTVKYDPDHFGAKGFNPPEPNITKKWINIGKLDNIAANESTGKSKKLEINLSELGYDKLLGKGQVTHAYRIKVGKCSRQAKIKIEKAGGKLEIGSENQ